MTKPLRVYLDTSVYGGCQDAAFSEDSLRVIEAVSQDKLIALTSEVVIRELLQAPQAVKESRSKLPEHSVEEVPLTDEVFALANAYLEAGILGPRQGDDAIHVAAATVARADAIVSWNFRHIVRLDKIKAYNQINLLNGYGILTIVTPKEVQTDAE